jgi:hypothetical protein
MESRIFREMEETQEKRKKNEIAAKERKERKEMGFNIYYTSSFLRSLRSFAAINLPSSYRGS